MAKKLPSTPQHCGSPYVPDVPAGTLVRLNEHLETQSTADAFCVQISGIAYFMQSPRRMEDDSMHWFSGKRRSWKVAANLYESWQGQNIEQTADNYTLILH